MKTRSIGPVAAVSLIMVVLFGCNPGRSQATKVSKGAETASSKEVFQASSDDDRRALVKQFQDRNGSAWNISGFTLGGLYDVDGFRPYIHNVWRNDARGPDVTMDADTAEAKARDFVTSNADLLGLTLDELLLLDVQTDPPAQGNPYYEHYLYFSKWQGTFSQPGYEDFPSVAANIEISVGVDRDGEIHAVLGSRNIHHPDLDLTTIPGLDAFDPTTIAQVVGTDVANYDAVGTEGYRTIYHKTELGLVEEEDIASRSLTIYVHNAPNLDRRTFTLAYELQVERGGYAFKFVVDAGTGDVLEAPKAPWGIIR